MRRLLPRSSAPTADVAALLASVPPRRLGPSPQKLETCGQYRGGDSEILRGSGSRQPLRACLLQPWRGLFGDDAI